MVLGMDVEASSKPISYVFLLLHDVKVHSGYRGVCDLEFGWLIGIGGT